MDIDRLDVSEHLKSEQRAWALRNDLPLNSRETGVANIGHALFDGLNSAAREQFASAPGGELQKMHSFRSSSALAVNVFWPWRHDPFTIAQLLGGTGEYDSISFEQSFPTGASHRHPHLDVVLGGGDVPIAVESKFVEPYDDNKERAVVSEAYFDIETLWEGMDDLRSFARLLSDDEIGFQRLEAAQLIKHSLGLAKRYGPHRFRLVYLWYEFEGRRADRHRDEARQFVDAVGPSVDMAVLTYQELFAELVTQQEPVEGYLKYLSDRYFRQ